MNHPFRFAAVIIAVFFLGLTPLAAQAEDSADRARAVTEQLLSRANQALLANDNAALREAIRSAFDFEIWERFLSEPRADRFSDEQRARFRDLLPGYLAYLYHEQFDRGLDTPPEIGELRPARKDVLVGATFKRAGGKDLPVQWRLRDTASGPQIIDVMVGGASFLLLKRDEFTSMIDRSGVEALLSFMEGHTL